MAHPDLERLFETLVSFSKELLTSQGEFYPWGATMDLNGVLGGIRAAGMACDVRVFTPDSGEKTDAIRCSLEHMLGESVDIFVPYRKDGSQFVYGERFSWIRDGRFFPRHPIQ